MLLYRLKELECSLQKDTNKNKNKLNSVTSLKNTLLKVDYKNEDIPEHSFEKIERVFISINNRELTEEEKELLRHIISI